MKLAIAPKSGLGNLAALLTIIFVVLIIFKMTVGFPLMTFIIAGIGLLGFIFALIAVIRKDFSVWNFGSIVIGLGILLFIAANAINSLGMFKDFPVKKSLNAEEAGNSVSKTVNLGTVSEKDGMIYYVYNEHLYSRKGDWTEQKQVSESKVGKIYISGDWIYYIDDFNGGKLYKMKTDGTEQTMISDDIIDNIDLSGDWIYYKLYPTAEVKASGGAIYKIKADGSEKIKLVGTSGFSDSIKVIGDYVYYNENFEGKGNLFRAKVDGTEKSFVAEGVISAPYVYGDWFYYCLGSNEKDGKETITIYRIKPDGTEKSLLTTIDKVYISTFDEDWFYYTSGKGLSRMKFDGTGNEKLNNVSIWGLMGVSGDWMYINDYGGPMFRVKLDGSVGTRLN